MGTNVSRVAAASSASSSSPCSSPLVSQSAADPDLSEDESLGPVFDLRFPQSIYPTGVRKPLGRGWLHLSESCVLLFWLLAFARSDLLVRHHVGKLMSCGASAFLHLCPHPGMRQYCFAVGVDCACIIVSIYAGLVGWLTPGDVPSHTAIAFIAAAGAGIASYFWGIAKWENNDIQAHRCYVIQQTVTAAYFVWVLWSGIYAGTSSSWFGSLPWDSFLVSMSIGFYVLLFALYNFAPVLPWHDPTLWLAHDDGHVALLVADVAMFAVLWRHGRL